MQRARGFTLIEVVLTVILVGMIIVLSSLLVKTISLSRHERYVSTATSIAQGEIESLRAVGYDQLPASGPFSDDALTQLPSGTGTFEVSAYDDATKKVIVTVSWTDVSSNTSPSVMIATLIAKTGGLK